MRDAEPTLDLEKFRGGRRSSSKRSRKREIDQKTEKELLRGYGYQKRLKIQILKLSIKLILNEKKKQKKDKKNQMIVPLT